jgi:2-iminobutanoate/2-iminopropanoate deaminase
MDEAHRADEAGAASLALLARHRGRGADAPRLPGRAGGIRPHGPDRQLVGAGDPAAQTRQAIENIRTLLRQAGGDLRDVVEMTVYATSAELMGPAGLAAQPYFTDPLPAQSFIVVKALARPELLVEIRAIAAIPLRRARRQGRAHPPARRRRRARRT